MKFNGIPQWSKRIWEKTTEQMGSKFIVLVEFIELFTVESITKTKQRTHTQ